MIQITLKDFRAFIIGEGVIKFLSQKLVLIDVGKLNGLNAPELMELALIDPGEIARNLISSENKTHIINMMLGSGYDYDIIRLINNVFHYEINPKTWEKIFELEIVHEIEKG